LSTYNKAPVIIPVDTPYCHCYKFHSKGLVVIKKRRRKREKKERSNQVLLKEFQSFQINGGMLSVKEQV
jgi:hypothetical protein